MTFTARKAEQTSNIDHRDRSYSKKSYSEKDHYPLYIVHSLEYSWVRLGYSEGLEWQTV